MTTYLLARTSTDQQDNGLEAQVERLQAEAARRGWQAEIIREHASGKTMKARPVFQDLLTRLQAGDRLVVTSLSRLSRSVKDFANILEMAAAKNFGIVVLDMDLDTSSAAGRAVAGVMVVFAQLERELNSERTIAALAHVKAQGKQLGHPSKVTAKVANKITAYRAQGMTLRAIADKLNADGVPGPAGGKWHANSVRRHAKE